MPLHAHASILVTVIAAVAAIGAVLVARRALSQARVDRERYAALAASLPGAAVSILDRDLNVVALGGDVARFGYDPDAVIGRNLREVATTRFGELEPHYRAALDGDVREFDWIATVGSQPVEVRLTPLHDEHGVVNGVMALSQDVSARRHAEHAVRSTEERHRKLVEALPGTIVATFDDDLIFTFVGGTGLEEGGWTVDEYLGRTIYDHLPPETADSIAEHFRASLGGASRAFDHHAPNGRSYRMRTVPLHDDHETIVGGLVVMQDMTEHREAEDRLRASERRLREIFGSLQEGIIVHDATGAIVSRNASAERMLSLEGHSMPTVGDTVWGVISEDGRTLAEDEVPVMVALDTGQPVTQVVGLVPPFGATRWLSSHCVPLFREGDHEPYAAVVSFTDISAAREAERLKDEFFTLISHELRTPLTSIAGYTEMLLEEDDDEQLTDTQRRFAQVVDRNAGRLQRLITDLLFVAQLEAGRLSFDVAKVDLDTVVRQAVDSARPHASDMAISLDANIAEAATRGDFDRLGQVIDNLISNAIKFTPPNGEVKVELEIEGAEAVVSVHDSGIGIPEPEIGDLFSKFVRASTAREREIPGVGIGLSICKAIVEGHGGSIRIDSSLGSGTIATVRLPLAQVAEESALSVAS